LVNQAKAESMFAGYLARCRGFKLLPSTLPDEPQFEADRYWRGPVWVPINWLVVRGLQDLGLTSHAAALADETVSLVLRSGWFEYFHPRTGEGLGGRDFSWTAALVVDLLRRPVS